LPTALACRGNLQGPWHSLHVWEAWPKLVVFSFMAVLVSYFPQFWGSGVI
jgi:hypothetical protein